jgi:hypothetical protein
MAEQEQQEEATDDVDDVPSMLTPNKMSTSWWQKKTKTLTSELLSARTKTSALEGQLQVARQEISTMKTDAVVRTQLLKEEQMKYQKLLHRQNETERINVERAERIKELQKAKAAVAEKFQNEISALKEQLSMKKKTNETLSKEIAALRLQPPADTSQATSHEEEEVEDEVDEVDEVEEVKEVEEVEDVEEVEEVEDGMDVVKEAKEFGQETPEGNPAVVALAEAVIQPHGQQKLGPKQFSNRTKMVGKVTRVNRFEVQNITRIKQAQERIKNLKGWTFTTTTRKQGKTAGQKDIYYIDPNGERYRSWVEVERVLEVHSSSKNDDDDDGNDEQKYPYHIGQNVEVYHYIKGMAQRWFEATIDAYYNDGIQIQWAVHNSLSRLYKITRGDVKSRIRLVREDKEVDEEKNDEDEEVDTLVNAETLYPVGQQVEVYYNEKKNTTTWFKATIHAHLVNGGIRIHWHGHNSLYTVPNKRVSSWIRQIGEKKEVQHRSSSSSSIYSKKFASKNKASVSNVQNKRSRSCSHAMSDDKDEEKYSTMRSKKRVKFTVVNEHTQKYESFSAHYTTTTNILTINERKHGKPNPTTGLVGM